MDELLSYYRQELTYLRRLGREFAEKYGDVAAALSLGPDASEDPHVERLLMGFSFLTARIRHKLDDDFPELTQALLGVLYPHYLAPIPSMAVVAFELDRERTTLTEGYPIPAGSLLETSPVDEEPCFFRTAYPVRIFPIELTKVSVRRRPFPANTAPADAQAALDLELSTLSPDLAFADLELDRLRFYLHGERALVHGIYEHVFVDLARVSIASEGLERPVELGPSHVREVGFGVGEGVLPLPARSQPAYRLLTEYFVFPEKYCFFDVILPPGTLRAAGRDLRLSFYLRELADDVERNAGVDAFRLGATPVINLFRRQAESIRTHHARAEYPVVPDHRRRQALEVYSVDGVTVESDGESFECAPFFSTRHGGNTQEAVYWHAARRPSSFSADGTDRGSEVVLSLVDGAFSPRSADTATLHIETTCLNRDLPNHLPFGGGEPRLELVDAAPEIAGVECLTRPTPTVRRLERGEWSWRLISHLTLDHLSLVSRDGSPEALRELLALYDYVDSPETRAKVESVRGLHVARTTARLSSAASESGIPGVCRGLRIDLDCDRGRFGDNGLVLFATVLERFFGLYATVNSFTQTRLRWDEKTRPREKRWPARSGERPLL